MASGDSITANRLLLMPLLAVLGHELRGLWSSWLVRLWLIASIVLAFVSIAPNWARMPNAPLIATVLFPYLVFPWFLAVFVLGISPVTGSRLDWLADGILSRPVTRHEYLLGSWTARVIVVLGGFLLVAIPSILLITLAKRPVADDHVTWYGAVAAVGVVSLVLTFLVSLAFLTGTLLRRPLLAIVVLVFVWFPINLILSTFALEQFSPISLAQALPTLLKTSWQPAPDDPGAKVNGEDLRELSNFLSVLAGGAGATVEPAQRGGFYEQRDYQDFSLLRVLAGYGVPTLAALALTTVLFGWRDL